jgi:uncharacterized protein (TIGR02594 family)
MKWLDIAWEQVGIQETTGGAATPAIKDYFRDAGRPDVTSDEIPWCAALVGACLDRAGIPQTIPPDKALLARSYASIGTDLAGQLQMGCVVVLSRGSDPASGHVGFCVGWTDEHVVLLGGNQANAVSVAHFSRRRIVATRWPQPPAVAEAGLAAKSRIVKAAQRQRRDAVKGGSSQAVPLPDMPADAPFPAPDALAATAAGKASAVQSALETLISFGGFVGNKLPYVLLAVGLYFGARMLWDSYLIQRFRAEDAATGKTTPGG